MFRDWKKKMIAAVCAVLVASCTAGCSIHGVSFGIGNFIKGEAYADAEEYIKGEFSGSSKEVEAIKIHWKSGRIRVTQTEDESIQITESGKNLEDKAQMRYYLKDKVLEVQFCASGVTFEVEPKDKYLEVKIPKNLQLTISATSADIKADYLEQRYVYLSSASGDIRLGEVSADTVDVSSTSGKITAESIRTKDFREYSTSGNMICKEIEADTITADSTSGNVNFESIAAINMNIVTTSGNVTMALPKDGASIMHTARSGKLNTNLDYDKEGAEYIFGDGHTKIVVESTSGSLEVK